MLVGSFNQEKALVGAFSVIMKTDCETDGALHSTSLNLECSHALEMWNVKAVVAAFNQEKALVGAFSVIMKTDCGTDGSICGTIKFVSDVLQWAGGNISQHSGQDKLGGANKRF